MLNFKIMVKTVIPVKVYGRNPNEQAVIVYAEIVERLAIDNLKVYKLKIVEFYDISYELDVTNELGEIEKQTFTKKVIIIQPDGKAYKDITYSFDQADYVSNILDQMYNITEVGSHRRAKYAELGHLLINNQDQVYGSAWELA